MCSDVILLRKFTEVRSGSRRSIGVFQCRDCLGEFESRTERAKVMTGLCVPCANKHGAQKRSTHGLNNRNSRLHVTWANMKRRCLNPRGLPVLIPYVALSGYRRPGLPEGCPGYR